MTAPDGMMPIPWDYLQENLVSATEIARRLEIDRASITHWKHRPGWPAPVLTFPMWTSSGIAELFWWPSVLVFCAENDVVVGRGLPRGRPPKDRPAS